MPQTCRFYYFLYSPETSVRKNGTHWKSLLPLTQNGLAEESQKDQGDPFILGDYFESVQAFLIDKGIYAILDVASNDSALDGSKHLIKRLNIILEKHGEFYHPAKIEAEVGGKKFSFVLNVAVSNEGNDLIEKEFHYLHRLNKTISPLFLPEVFCLGKIHTKNHWKVSMFLAQWFEGFYEFHLSYDPGAGKMRIKVWSPNGGFFLTEGQTASLYRQAAKILTTYYTVDTYEQVLSWHHAAGDFVVRVEDRAISLKLVTVRNYSSMFNNGESSETTSNSDTILEALLLFLLNISIRMRLDRWDGVGDLVWADDIAVENCLIGFYEGLKSHPGGGLQENFADVFFVNYLSKFSRSMLTGLCNSLVKRTYQNCEEVDLIQRHLTAHVKTLYTSVQSLADSFRKQI